MRRLVDPNRLLNAALILLFFCRSGWWAYDWIRAQFFSVGIDDLAGTPSPPRRRQQRPRAPGSVVDSGIAKVVSVALERCNASVLAALLADAASTGVQHTYLQKGFVAPGDALDPRGLALRDLAASLRITPAGIGRDSEDLKGKLFPGVEIGGSTNYGEHLLMVLPLVLPKSDEPGVFEFGAFQRAWHRWQLGKQHQHRGLAAEIALKNLERGLVNRQAATLVGDIGAVPRLLGLLAAFTLEACQRLLRADPEESPSAILRPVEEQLAGAAREISMTTHDRAEALAAAEFLVRVAFRLAFRETLLSPTPEARQPLDRSTMPSLVWRAAHSVKQKMGVSFVRRVLQDAEQLCRLQQRRAALGGELGGTGKLDTAGDLADLGGHHTRRLPTPQSDERQRELFGLSGGINAALPAALYLAWKYERHPAAALTANTLLGGNAAGRGVVLGMLLGARCGILATPRAWMSQFLKAEEALTSLQVLTPERAKAGVPALRYSPCPTVECGADDEVSEVVTSSDVRVSARVLHTVEDGTLSTNLPESLPKPSTEGNTVNVESAAPSTGTKDSGIWAEGKYHRRLVVRLNISNTGATGLPFCPHGKLWLLWEAGGFARGRFRDVGDAVDAGNPCLAPRMWAIFDLDASSAEPDALRPGPQWMVGLLEVVRPLRGPGAENRLLHPGVGNLVRCFVGSQSEEEHCEHFAAKIGRFKIPSLQ